MTAQERPGGGETAMGIDAVSVPAYGGDPVVIVGNGPVGQTLALLLARWGIGSVVLDRRPERDLVGSKAICQHGDVLDIWDTVGAGRAIADEGTTWARARSDLTSERQRRFQRSTSQSCRSASTN